MRIRSILLLTVAALLSHAAYADTITISQIDTSSLLTRQRVGVFVSAFDSSGNSLEGLGKEMFRLSESADGEHFTPVEVTSFSAQTNQVEGINFFLLVDNSGSMYDTLAGTQTSDERAMRITHAKEAIRTFLDDIDNPNDRVGLASFNTFYRLYTQPIPQKAEVGQLLDRITRPDSDAAYTELYAALVRAATDAAEVRGRKVIIVLSDGENYPYVAHSGKDHPEYGSKVFEYTESIEQLQRQGVSLFAVNFGANKDQHLAAIASATGGQVFDARNEEELAQVYRNIRERVLKEYYLTYRATMTPADRKFVRVIYRNGARSAQATRFYFSSTLFGSPAPGFGPLFFLPLLAALLLFWLLTRMRFLNKRKEASLEVLGSGSSTRVFPVSSQKTVIGRSESADVTLVGSPRVQDKHATLLFNPQTRVFSVAGDEPIMVNNKPVKKKDLKPGDVINVGGTMVVFDEPEEEGDTQKKKK